MSLPQIAIVGRPNVGKSSLLNRLARRRVSIVDPTPGVTRDRVAVILEVDPPIETPKGTPPKLVEIIDTGGWGVYTAEGKQFNDIGEDLAQLTPDIEKQIRTAMQQAAVIAFLFDAQTGVTPLDESIADLLRTMGVADRVMMVANKVDGDSWLAHGQEAAGLGFGDVHCLSASTGHGVRDLLDALYEHIPASIDAVEDDNEDVQVAIVGRRNAGKSTLINALAGQPRVIVSEIAGTTRDSIDVQFTINGETMTAIDTAGMRKRKSMADDIEYYAYHRMLSAIRRANVVLLLIDATDEVSQVEKKLTQELQRQYKPTVIVVNKIDKLNKDTISPEDYIDYLTEQLRGFDYAPIVFISALESDGLDEVVAMAFNLHKQARHRETTGRLNDLIGSILKKRGPSSRLGTQAKLYFVSQISVSPPTIAMVVNQPKLFRGQYERYLMNRLREELPYSEVPIRLLFRKRERMKLHDLKQQGFEANRQSRRSATLPTD